MSVGRSRGTGRGFRLLAVQSLALALGACGVSSNVLPAENATSTSFASYEAVEAAYDKVQVGETDEPGLAQLGFGAATTPNFERASYLTVMNRFLPDPSIRFEDLPPPVQKCINAQERCSALAFFPAHVHSQRTGGVVTDFLGFERVTNDTGWSAEAIFVMLDGKVVYKELDGKPKTQEVRDMVQPLGPLTNLGNTAVRVGKGFGGKF